jgi:hypothetical protein
MCHYFPVWTVVWRSFCTFGEDDSISKNKETINKPAIAAPINISDPSFPAYPLAR